MNTIVGDLEKPNITFLAECKAIDGSANSHVVSRAVYDVLRRLCIERANFFLLLTDAARYMTVSGETLKVLYLGLQRHLCCQPTAMQCTFESGVKLNKVFMEKYIVLYWLTI